MLTFMGLVQPRRKRRNARTPGRYSLRRLPNSNVKGISVESDWTGMFYSTAPWPDAGTRA